MKTLFQASHSLGISSVEKPKFHNVQLSDHQQHRPYCNPVFASKAISMDNEDHEDSKLWADRFHFSRRKYEPARFQIDSRIRNGSLITDTEDLIKRFTDSIIFDKELCKYEIMGDRAVARRLMNQGLISASDRERIISGLNIVEVEIEDGKIKWIDGKDVHTNIVEMLFNKIGEPAKKLPSVSQYDQVFTILEMWCHESLHQIVAQLRQLQVELILLAIRNDGDLLLPSETEREIPVYLGIHLMYSIRELERYIQQLDDCGRYLGACFCGGSRSLNIDTIFSSEWSSIDSVMNRCSALGLSARPKHWVILEFMLINSQIGDHLSKLVEDWSFWRMDQFFFGDSDFIDKWFKLKKAYLDRKEFVQGGTADLARVLNRVLSIGMASVYSLDDKDLKKQMFRSVKCTLEMLRLSIEVAQSGKFSPQKVPPVLAGALTSIGYFSNVFIKRGFSEEISFYLARLCLGPKAELPEHFLLSVQWMRPCGLNEPRLYTEDGPVHVQYNG